jgi:5-methylcytosine-specific restriction endonuclease McrA
MLQPTRAPVLPACVRVGSGRRHDAHLDCHPSDGHCYACSQKLRGDAWEAEHPQARELGGSDDIDALMPICIPCHKPKTAADQKTIAKAKRVRDKHIGAVKRKSSFPTNRDKPFKKRMDGSVVLRDPQ